MFSYFLSSCYTVVMKDLLTVVETLPPELQTEVYEYALSLRETPLPQPLPHSQPLILDMHKGALTMASDFDEALPDTFWLGEE